MSPSKIAMGPLLTATYLLVLAAARALAQHPLTRQVDAVEVRFARAHPVIGYRLRVDSLDLTTFDVEMRVLSKAGAVCESV